jgi:protein-S-isoprenylcysteine O-methyltransferase Ste14
MNKLIPTTVAVTLCFLLLVLADLVPFWMPMMGEMVALLIVVVLLLIWGGYVMQEDARDEREVELKMRSGRVAYLGGLSFLMLALIVQGLNHAIDPWIAGALAVMVGAKLLARLYIE